MYFSMKRLTVEIFGWYNTVARSFKGKNHGSKNTLPDVEPSKSWQAVNSESLCRFMVHGTL